jgi:hypothetical protein
MTKSNGTAKSRALADALSGVAAALVSLWVFYPIDVWKTHVQAGRKPPPLRRMMSSGLEMKSVHTASSSFFYFYLYSWIVSLWTSRKSHSRVSASSRLLLSAVAAMLNTCLTLPLDVLSARHQTMDPNIDPTDLEAEFVDAREEVVSNQDERNDDSRVPFDKPSTSATFTPPNNGVGSAVSQLWKGFRPSLMLCSNPAINYTVFDTIKSRYTMHGAKENLSMPEAFLLGLFSKFVATIATYPLIRAKVMLMVTSQASMIECLQDAYREKGVAGLYEGCELQLLHTMLKSALLMMIRERIAETTRRWVAGSDTSGGVVNTGSLG